eukprot:5050484-Amphidinium_carterae.2
MAGQATYFAGHAWPGLEDLSYLGVAGPHCDSIEIGDDSSHSTSHTLLMTKAGIYVATADPLNWRKLGNKAMITSAIKRIRM